MPLRFDASTSLVLRRLNVFLLLLATTAEAQVSLRVGAITTEHTGASGQALTITPRLELRDGPARGALEFTWSRFDSGERVWQTGFEVSNSTNVLGGTAGLLAAANANVLNSDFSATGSATVMFGRGIGPVVAGVGAGFGLLRPLVGSESHRLRNVVATVSGELHGTRAQVRGQHVWLSGADYDDVTLLLGRRTGRLSMEAMAGARMFDLFTDGLWQVSAAFQFAAPLALEASAGRSPTSPEGFARGYFATLGLRLSAPPRPLHPAVSITSLGNGLVRVTITVRAARAVFIGGSWNEWNPVAMREEGNGRWSIELPLRAGAHRFGLRRGADGDWFVPDGVPSLPDDFGGRVGLIVIE